MEREITRSYAMNTENIYYLRCASAARGLPEGSRQPSAKPQCNRDRTEQEERDQRPVARAGVERAATWSR
jgi:hypothetical protein